MSSVGKVAEAFQSKGYQRSARIKQHTFFLLLDEMLGEPFDVDVGNELWDQAELNAKQEAEVDQLCTIICQAQGILVDKISQINQKVHELQARKRQIDEDQTMRSQLKSVELKRVADEIEELKRDLSEFKEDLELVTVPFGAKVPQKDSNRPYERVSRPYSGNHESEYQPVGTPVHALNDQLKWVLWLTLGILFLQIFMMNVKYDFLNLLVLVTILSIFLLNYFDTSYIKICCGLTSISIILDLIWLIMYASDFWSPPAVGVYSQNQTGILRTVVFFTILIMCAKVPLVYLLFRYRDVSPDSMYTVSLFGAYKIHLTANKSNNLISKGIFSKATPV